MFPDMDSGRQGNNDIQINFEKQWTKGGDGQIRHTGEETGKGHRKCNSPLRCSSPHHALSHTHTHVPVSFPSLSILCTCNKRWRAAGSHGNVFKRITPGKKRGLSLPLEEKKRLHSSPRMRAVLGVNVVDESKNNILSCFFCSKHECIINTVRGTRFQVEQWLRQQESTTVYVNCCLNLY